MSARKTDARALVKQAESYCEAKGIRFTKPRALVLGIVASSTKPVGAYDILAEMAKKMPNPKPPTAYRAIEFLQAHGFIHRIASLNAFTVCRSGHKHAGSQFMICDGCGHVEEAHLCTIPQALDEKARLQGFAAASWDIELHGTCRDCLQGAPPHRHDHIHKASCM